MPAPSPLSIGTSSVLRLVKEETTYHAELQQQEARLKKLQSTRDQHDNASTAEQDNGNAEFEIQQQKRAINETKALFPELKKRIKDALAGLEQQLVAEHESGTEPESNEMDKAKEAIEKAQASLKQRD